MQTATAAFAAEVEGVAMTAGYVAILTVPAGVSTAYQDLSDCVTGVDLSEQITGTAQDGTTLINGYPTATLALTLEGLLANGIDAATFFDTENPASPMYGRDIDGLALTFDAGVYTDPDGNGEETLEALRKFTGVTDEVVIANGVVTLTCLDKSGGIRGAASLQPVITAAPYNSNLTAEYPMEQLLRYSSPDSYYTRPPERANCVLSVGFRACLWPDVGTYTGFFGPPSFVSGTYGSALFNGSAGYTPATVIQTADTAFVEFRAKGNCMVLLKNAASGHSVQIQTFSGGLFITTTTASGTATGTTIALDTTVEHYFGVKINWAQASTAVSGTYYYDTGAATAWSFTALNARLSTDTWETIQAFARVTADGALSELQATTETAPASNGAFVRTAFLDPSLNPLSALPDVSGKTRWQVLQEIVAAEDGVIGLDEHGAARFRNRQTLRSGTSQRTIQAKSSLLSLEKYLQRSMVANHIQIPVTPLAIQPFGVVWRLSGDPIAIAGGATLNLIAQLDNGVLALGTTPAIVPPGGVLAAGTSGYRASKNFDGSGGEVANLVMTISPVSAKQVALTFTNPNSFPIWLVSPQGTTYADSSDGQPVVFIGGQAVLTTGAVSTDTTATSGAGVTADAQWPPVRAGGAATNKRGEILLALPQNDWAQDLDSQTVRANELLSDLNNPKMLYRNVSIVFDPRIQLTDRHTLLDPDVNKVNNDVLVLGSQLSLSNTQWVQTLDLRAVYRPGKWILGRAGRSELGQTTNI